MTEHTAYEHLIHAHLKQHVTMNKHKHTRMSENSGRRWCLFIACFLRLILPSEGLSNIWRQTRHLSTCIYLQFISVRFSSNDSSFPSWRRRKLHPISSELTPSKFREWECKKQMNRWQMKENIWGNIFRQNAVNKSKGCVCLCSFILCITLR